MFFTKKIKTTKNNQIEILKPKDSINAIKNKLVSLEIEQTRWRTESVI